MGNNTSVEEKEEDTDSENDFEYRETVVNENDFRKPIHKFVSQRDLQIIKCIGQIEVEYYYHPYQSFGYGTGTVYKVSNNGVVFILTCAHNVRYAIRECASCNTYTNKKKKCSTCKKWGKKKLIKPTCIKFHRCDVTNKDFGNSVASYECEEVFVPDAYEQHQDMSKGFDFAILTFLDHSDGYYAQHCHNINIGIGVNVLKTQKRFSIFGYPGPDKNKEYPNVEEHKLYGYAVESDRDEKGIEFVECEQWYGGFARKTEYILRQCWVDCSPGQSGSALFVKTNEKDVVIFGIHVGGHRQDNDMKDDYAFNKATLLGKEYIAIMNAVTEDGYRKKTTVYTNDNVVTRVHRSGWLQKQSKYLRSWRNRWTILYNRELYTYENESKENDATETIQLNSINAITSGCEEGIFLY
eukprot:447601_1